LRFRSGAAIRGRTRPLKAIVEDAPCIVRAALGSKSSIPTAGVNRTVRLRCAQRGIASAQRRTIASAVEALETGTGIADRIGQRQGETKGRARTR